ncbi:MAG: hypothetical protein M3Y09_18965 [Actinomycetota bacterium]|nr:hypothetical protein [Actinomycetota bacterium]
MSSRSRKAHRRTGRVQRDETSVCRTILDVTGEIDTALIVISDRRAHRCAVSTPSDVSDSGRDQHVG